MKFAVSVMTGDGAERVSSGTVGFIEANDVVDAADKLGLHMTSSGQDVDKVDGFYLSDDWRVEVYFDELVEVTPLALATAAVKLAEFKNRQTNS